MHHHWSNRLWGAQAKVGYLLVAAALLLLTFLGGREIWTQEHRWADIVSAMLYHHDYFHPSLNGTDYYDKPLLSYWLIIGFSTLMGKFSAWSMRLPSALAGILAIWSIYRLGSHLKNKSLGLLAGWMLLTTFYFIFWARTSSADMLNVAGTLFAVSWYFDKKSAPSIFNYAIFFLILAVTALCKGLVGPVVAGLVILPDMLLNRTLKTHLHWRVLVSLIPAAIVYTLPFWASTHVSSQTGYGENGLYLVYRENILRYFQPFDHKGPLYTYFVFLPVYLLPWTLFFIPALVSIKSRWKSLSTNSKWMIWATAILFVFFTLSGSRRNYYILPVVPFAILMTADWILCQAESIKRNQWAGRIAVIFASVFFFTFGVSQALYYANGGMVQFAEDIKTEATKVQPWSKWQFVMLDPESKVRFYLRLSPETKNMAVIGGRHAQTTESLLQTWPLLNHPASNTIYVSRMQYEPLLRPLLKDYDVVEGKSGWGQRLFRMHNPNLPVAFIPKKIG